MTKRIFRSILVVSFTALLACLVIVMGVLYEYSTSIQKTRLKTELDLAATGVEQNGVYYLKAVNNDGYRLTWIDNNGTVLFDSKANTGKMENHADREEFRKAIESGVGESERYSATLTEKTIYYAVKLPDGTVLRISIEQITVVTLVFGMLQPILIVFIIVLIISGVLASHMAKQIVEPLNELDLEHPLEAEAYDELSPLLRRINQLHRQVDSQVIELRRKKEEFEQITMSMNEGLVLLDDKNIILSINSAAMKLFGTDDSCVGNTFLTIERSYEINEAIQSAMNDGHGEIQFKRNGREYQFEISCIKSGGSKVGAVLLAFDVTEKVFAERNRREFTANVSHELKTPLQAIMGSAELIKNGLVKPDDMSRFVGHIYSEAARLVSLIEDIIMLSQLDEKSELLSEEVNLLELACETTEELQYAADTKKIKVNVSGEETIIQGVRKLLAEILFNICDNAIKYNCEGGRVDILVSHDKNNALITIEDTGIGISPEHQDRIFERFYRVDKSHSKKSGGTGLGLSIVKHAVAYHNGTIELESVLGKGSKFIITFPNNAEQK